MKLTRLNGIPKKNEEEEEERKMLPESLGLREGKGRAEGDDGCSLTLLAFSLSPT